MSSFEMPCGTYDELAAVLETDGIAHTDVGFAIVEVPADDHSPAVDEARRLVSSASPADVRVFGALYPSDLNDESGPLVTERTRLLALSLGEHSIVAQAAFFGDRWASVDPDTQETFLSRTAGSIARRHNVAIRIAPVALRY